MGDDDTYSQIDSSAIDTTMAVSGSYFTVGSGGGYAWSSPTLNITNGGTGATTYNYTTAAPAYNSGIVVDGDANFKGDVKINGKSIVETLSAIEKRLSILTPDPKKLAKYEALQKAYEHYKTLEAMCYDDE